MSLTKEQIAAHVEELRLQGQACDGFTVGVVAALTFIITKAAGMAPADLAGLPDQSLWQAACKAHAKRPDLVQHFQAKRVAAESEECVLINLDGEQPGRLPIEIEVLPRALNLVK